MKTSGSITTQSGQDVNPGDGQGWTCCVPTPLLVAAIPPHPQEAPELPGQQQGQRTKDFPK